VGQVKANKTVKRPLPERKMDVILTLNPLEQRALNYWKRIHFKRNSHNTATVAYWMVLYALHAEDAFSEWVNRTVRYCEAEDIDQTRWVQGNLKARRHYTRAKLPAH
jgi:hypothetical protein